MTENNNNNNNKIDKQDHLPLKYNLFSGFLSEDELEKLKSKQSLDYSKDPAKFLIILGSILAGTGTILLIVFSIIFIFSNIEFSCRPQPCTPLTGAPLYFITLGMPSIPVLIGIVSLAIGFYKRKHKKD